MKKNVIEISAYVVLALTASWASAETNAYRPRMDEDGWEILFDGKTSTHGTTIRSRACGRSTRQANCIRPSPDRTSIPSSDTAISFWNWTIRWPPGKKATAAFFFRVHDAQDPSRPACKCKSRQRRLQSAFQCRQRQRRTVGLVCPAVDANVAIGQWNHGRITANDNQIVIELNGKQIVKTDLNQWTTPHTNPDGSRNKCRYVPDVIGAVPSRGLYSLGELQSHTRVVSQHPHQAPYQPQTAVYGQGAYRRRASEVYRN